MKILKKIVLVITTVLLGMKCSAMNPELTNIIESKTHYFINSHNLPKKQLRLFKQKIKQEIMEGITDEFLNELILSFKENEHLWGTDFINSFSMNLNNESYFAHSMEKTQYFLIKTVNKILCEYRNFYDDNDNLLSIYKSNDTSIELLKSIIKHFAQSFYRDLFPKSKFNPFDY